MKKILAAALSLMAAAVTGVSAVAADAPVKVDFSKKYQEIDGFGASYTWYSDWMATNDNREEAYDWIFNDSGFNILRFRDLNHVGDEYQNALDGYPAYYSYYKAAVDRGNDPLVLVTSWGQYDRDLPWVAYTEHSANGFSYYTLAKDSNGEYMYQELADFCVESVKLFFDAGIPVDYFSISNEIELQERHVDETGKAREEAGFFFGQEENDDHCCYWKAHIAVYNAFKEAFGEYAPKLLGAETMAGYEDLLRGYLDPVIRECPESLEIIGHHLYGTDLSPANFKKIGDSFSNDYKIWQTEIWNDDYFGHAKSMLDELIYENVSAYLYWNGVWNFDAGKCLIEIDGPEPTAEFRRLGNQYLMTHFSKYIKRGYRRVDVAEELNSTVGAFLSPDESELVLVIYNPSEEYDDLTLDIGGRKILDSMSLRSTEGENRFAHDYLIDEGKYKDGYEIMPKSLYTVVLTLEGNPDYVAPAVEEKVNPFVKNPSSDKAVPLIIAGAVGLCAVIVVVVAAVGRKGKRKDS